MPLNNSFTPTNLTYAPGLDPYVFTVKNRIATGPSGFTLSYGQEIELDAKIKAIKTAINGSYSPSAAFPLEVWWDANLSVDLATPTAVKVWNLGTATTADGTMTNGNVSNMIATSNRKIFQGSSANSRSITTTYSVSPTANKTFFSLFKNDPSTQGALIGITGRYAQMGYLASGLRPGLVGGLAPSETYADTNFGQGTWGGLTTVIDTGNTTHYRNGDNPAITAQTFGSTNANLIVFSLFGALFYNGQANHIIYTATVLNPTQVQALHNALFTNIP
jgi:hypothetical protein